VCFLSHLGSVVLLIALAKVPLMLQAKGRTKITTVQADSELSVTHKLTSDHVSEAHFGIICN
jgi:hypothetical protein